jgi:hypothetical protein|tara:strand:- start:2444 stop:3691 length:1248 start_codon:yes stop_codon:yes gene_type:complete
MPREALFGFLRSSLSRPSKQEKNIFAARVRYAMLEGETQPQVFKKFGEYQSIGGIFFNSIEIPNPNPEFSTDNFALPLFPNISNVPVENEIVYIITLPSNNIQNSVTSTVYYYFQPVNIWGSVHHNAIPNTVQNIFNPSQNVAQANDYQKTEGGTLRRVTDGSTEIDLGDTFNERIDVRNLQPYEGDIIYEGRWGQSLRLGSTVSGSVIPNPWSNSGTNGDPITILRNGQHEEDTKPWIPQVEDINTDASSIYLTSNQLIPISGSSTVYDSYFFPPTKLNEYSGEQIILNSGRLVLNSKSDSIMLSSFKTIGLNSLNSINIDSPSTVVKSKKIALGDKNASEPMILGNKFLTDFEQLCRDINTLAEVLSRNPIGGPGDISPVVIGISPAAVDVASSAAEMLSKVAQYKSSVTTSK